MVKQDYKRLRRRRNPGARGLKAKAIGEWLLLASITIGSAWAFGWALSNWLVPNLP